MSNNHCTALTKKRNNKPIIFYVLVLLFCVFTYLTFKYPDWADATRALDATKEVGKYFHSLNDVIRYSFEEQYDFVYNVIRWLIYAIGLDAKVLLILILFSFFYSISEILRSEFNNITKKRVLIIYTLFSCPFIYLHGITRNLLAIVFLYWSYYFFKKRKIVLGLLFIILSVFTHITIVFFIAVIAFAFFLSRYNFSLKIERITLVSLLLISFVFSGLLLNNFLFFAELLSAESTHYLSYTSSFTSLHGLWLEPDLNYGVKIPCFYTLVFSVYLLFVNKRRDVSYWILYVSTILFSFLAQSSTVLAERCIMFMPLFVGSSIFATYYDSDKKGKKTISLLCIVGLLTVLIHFVQIRHSFNWI